MEAHLGRQLIAMAGCLAGLALAGAGCSTTPAHGEKGKAGTGDVYGPSPPPNGVTADDPYGPTPPPGGVPAPSAGAPAASAEPGYGPERIQYRPVILVLGPGMARGFAHVGVIRALAAAKIPIAGIIGTEMGAFVAALYAADGNLNHFEWSLQKFKDDEFGTGQGFLSKIFEGGPNGRRFEDDLESVFGKRDLSSCKIPLRIGLSLGTPGHSLYVGQGSIAKAVRAAMGAPGLLSAGKWNGGPAFAATRAEPFGTSEAKNVGEGSVVVVDVSWPGQIPAEELPELRNADLVIHPDLKGINPSDFGKRTETAFRGSSAVEGELHEIRHLVGLPENTGSEEASQ